MSLEEKNTVTYSVEYKKTDDTLYTSDVVTKYEEQYLVENGIYVFEAEKNAGYNIILRITDNFDTVEKRIYGPSVLPFMSRFRNGLGIAWNKLAELEGVFDIGFKTKFSGGILQPILKSETDEAIDFDTLIIPNTYALQETSVAGYLNCPISSGKGTLIIKECGDNGEIHQIVNTCNKTNPQKFERFYSDEVWGEWICTSKFEGNLLWSGGSYVNDTQTCILSELVSEQAHGIVLAWSYYNGTAQNFNWNYFFVPKHHVSKHNGTGIDMINPYDAFKKYVYVYNDKIMGHENNDNSGTNNNINWDNTKYVLRYVIGV